MKNIPYNKLYPVDDDGNRLFRREKYEPGDLVRVYVSGLESRSARSGNVITFYDYDLIKKEKRFIDSISVPINNVCLVIRKETILEDEKHWSPDLYILMYESKYFLCSVQNIFEV